MRVLDRSRTLEIITPPPDGYSVDYLRDVAQQAKIYVRPIQRACILLLVTADQFQVFMRI